MLTVVMPVYNTERYVAKAIESVLGQTLGDFKFLVADDGSTDRSLEIARSYEPRDPRITVVGHGNIGLCNTMNGLIDRASTEWVAVMHGDDIMLPNRLERQLAFVTKNPDVSLTSSLVEWIDEEDRTVGYSRCHLTTRDAVAAQIAAGEVLAFPHPAAMFRKSVAQAVGGYRQTFFPAEDVELWNRIADAGHGVLVQPEVLLKYRTHSKSTSMTRAALVMRNLRWIQACTRSRRAGGPELTLSEFQQSRRDAGVLQRIDDCRIDWSHCLYQRALTYYTDRQYLFMAPAMLGAVMLRPLVFLPRLLARVGGRHAA